jgi:hypothetical protein
MVTLYPRRCYSPPKFTELTTVADWPTLLRRLRTRRANPRGRREARIHRPATIKAYELGSGILRDLLVSVLDALKADLLTRNQADWRGLSPTTGRIRSAQNEWFTFDEAVRRWSALLPSHLNNETMDVVAANIAMQRVWEVDLRFDNTGPFELNFLSMLSAPRVAGRIQNWDEAISTALSILKGHYGGDSAIQSEMNPYFAAAIQHFLQGEPEYVQRFLQIWTTVEPRQRKLRWAYPVVWQHPLAGRLSFHVQVNPADAIGSRTFNDWIPVDDATWAGLQLLAGSKPAACKPMLQAEDLCPLRKLSVSRANPGIALAQ